MSNGRIFKLLGRIIRRGKLHASGPDFSSLRAQALGQFMPYIPAQGSHNSGQARLRSPFLRYWAGQAAFLRQAYRDTPASLRVAPTGLNYIRIPRSASTSMAYALLSQKYPDIAIRNLSAAQINFITDVNIERIMPGPQETYFTVVRNPFARLVSVYREFFERPGDDFIYADYLFGILRKEMSFGQFVLAVRDIPDLLKDQHMKPQHEILRPYWKRNIPVRVLKLEEPGPLQEFLSTYGLTIPMLNSRPEGYDYRIYYDRTTLAAALNIYKSDIRVFKYEQTTEKLRIDLDRKIQDNKF